MQLTKTPGKLVPPTPAQITAVTDVLEHQWASNALMVQTRYTQAIERDDHNAASKWALAGAISTDKILVLKGRPTDIIGHVHAHRHDLSAVMDKLAMALRPAQITSIQTESERSTVGRYASDSEHDAQGLASAIVSLPAPVGPVIRPALTSPTMAGSLDQANDAVLTPANAPQHGHDAS